MNNISKEYANALYELSKEENIEETINESLCIVEEILNENSKYIEFLSLKNIPKSERISNIRQLLKNRVHQYVCSFVCILCEKEEIGIINSCFDEYRKLYYSSKNIMIAKIKSAVPLSDTEKSNITSKLESYTNYKIEAQYEIDKSLIGGLSIYIDGNVMDNSIKRKLNEIKEVMNSESKV